MNFAPYQWRFDGGYQPADDAIPYLFAPPYPFAEPAPQPTQHQHQWQPATYIQGPVPVRAVFAPPPSQPYFSPPSQPPPPPPPPPPPAHPTPPSANTIDRAIDRAFAPPRLRPGTNYFFPAGHTMVHVFNRASKVWQAKYAQQALGFKIFKIGTTLRVADIIRRVLRCDQAGDEDEDGDGDEGGAGGRKKKDKDKKSKSKGGEKKRKKKKKSSGSTSSGGGSGKGPPPDPAQGWAATEVLESGDGSWAKGMTVAYGTPRANATLASLGWDERRGKSLPPVWVVVHKV